MNTLTFATAWKLGRFNVNPDTEIAVGPFGDHRFELVLRTLDGAVEVFAKCALAVTRNQARLLDQFHDSIPTIDEKEISCVTAEPQDQPKALVPKMPEPIPEPRRVLVQTVSAASHDAVG